MCVYKQLIAADKKKRKQITQHNHASSHRARLKIIQLFAMPVLKTHKGHMSFTLKLNVNFRKLKKEGHFHYKNFLRALK